MHVRSFARWRMTACAALIVGSLLAPKLALGQVTRYEYKPAAFQVSTNGPSGASYPISVTAEGRISEFYWGFDSTGWGDLHIRYTLPDGTYFEQVAGSPWVSVDQLYGKNAAGTWTLRLTENQAGRSETFNTGFSLVALRDARTDLQASGVTVPELAGVDSIVMDWMRANQVEATTVAVMRNGKLVLSKGYGWQDRARTTLTSPNAVGRWASNTKAVTAAAIRILVAQGALSLSSKAWDVMNTPPPVGYTVTDTRHYLYTIDELLNHRAGLQRDLALQAGPLGAQLGLGRPANIMELAAYQWTIPLASDPDPDPSHDGSYSNWGYQLLGAIIERASGMSYDSFIRTYVTGPLGATTFQVGRRGPGNALPNELWYAGHTFIAPQWDWNDSMALVEDAYGDDLETRPGAGSLVSSAPDYMRFLKGYYHTGVPKPPNPGPWDYAFYGGGPGNSSATRELIGPDGTSLEWAVLVNESPTDGEAIHTLRNSLDAYFAGITTWPTIDLFNGSGCKAVSGGQSGNFGTTGPACFTVSGSVNGWGCSNTSGRTVTINGTSVACGSTPLPGSSPYTFSFSGGTYPWASFYWY